MLNMKDRKYKKKLILSRNIEYFHHLSRIFSGRFSLKKNIINKNEYLQALAMDPIALGHNIIYIIHASVTVPSQGHHF